MINTLLSLINNITKFNETCKDKKLSKELNLVILNSFLSDSNYIRIEKDNNKIIGIILGKIKDLKDQNQIKIDPIKINYEIIKNHNKQDNSFIEFQKEIIKTISKIKNEYIFDNELIMFSSLEKGYGKKLIENFHNTMIKNNQKIYFLITNSTCNWRWYIKNKYMLIKIYMIDGSELHDKKILIMIFKKEIK